MQRAVTGTTVRLTRTYDAPVADVWDAVTSPERLPRWFLPVSGELRPGGRFQLEGNAGGTIESCDPPHAFAATWEFGGQLSRIRVTLAPHGDKTELTLEHDVPDDDHWRQFGPGAVGVGWDMGLMGLGRHLESGAAVDPAEAMAWFGSPEGREFVTESAHAWGEAHAADGAADAQAAAERTLAAYAPQS
jgi:uncharacterized protein YndB with AHSA1/START domain